MDLNKITLKVNYEKAGLFINFGRLNEYIIEKNKNLLSDTHFIYSIKLEDIGNNKFELNSTYLEENDTFLVVFPEHYPPFIFEKELLEHYQIINNKTNEIINVERKEK